MLNNLIGNYMKNRILGVLVMALALSMCNGLSAQNNEHIFILWDVTGSLLPSKSGEKDLDGKAIPAYASGNGMWKDLKKAVIDCIEYTEEDPGNEITIVTFQDKIRDIFTRNVSDEGKKELVDFVKNYQYQAHKFTNIVAPIKKFYSLIGADKINYMFLFTDGDNDDVGTKASFIPTLDDWTGKTHGNNAFGFYVLVHPDADKPEIRHSVDKQDNFWIVPDAKVRIKICSFPSSLKYNLRDSKGPLDIGLKGKYAGAAGNVRLEANDEYYDVVCSNTAIKDGRFAVEVKPKNGINPPANHIITLTPSISGADKYTFVGPKDIALNVTNLPERNLCLTVDDNDFGTATYYGPFLFSSESNKPVSKTVHVDFNDQSGIENSSALLNIYFVDKKGNKCNQNLKLYINGKELNGGKVKLTPGMTEMELSVSGEPDTKNGTFYGRMELIPSNLDNFCINGTPDIFNWKVKFKQKCNPVKIALYRIGGLLIFLLLLWKFVLMPKFYPKFGSIQKTFMAPGMAPLTIKFKGARMVVVSAEKPKQSVWNKFWTGKIIYEKHVAFTTPIIFKPSRGRRILACAQAGIYQILPNPMPGVGPAKIVDIKNNVTISVN